MLRPQSNEAHAGKYPIRSPGRIYPHVCRYISEGVWRQDGRDVTVGLQSFNGVPLDEPRVTLIDENGEEFKRADKVSVDGSIIVDAITKLQTPDELGLDIDGRTMQ